MFSEGHQLTFQPKVKSCCLIGHMFKVGWFVEHKGAET
jgi:hypothetical protein